MQFDQMRSDPASRIRELQDTYLRWLYVQTEQRGLNPTVSEFMATSPGFHGVPYTDQELLKAGVRLKEGGFIEGEGRFSYPAPAQPRLTARGRSVIDKNRSVHDESDQPALQYFNTTVHGNANVANDRPAQHCPLKWARRSRPSLRMHVLRSRLILLRGPSGRSPRSVLSSAIRLRVPLAGCSVRKLLR
jgi:hypothetical protein